MEDLPLETCSISSMGDVRRFVSHWRVTLSVTKRKDKKLTVGTDSSRPEACRSHTPCLLVFGLLHESPMGSESKKATLPQLMVSLGAEFKGG